MKRLLCTTTALSLGLAPLQPLPLLAQSVAEDGALLAADGAVLCPPGADVPCDLDSILALLAAQGQTEISPEVLEALTAALTTRAGINAAAEAAALEAELKRAEEEAAAEAAEAARQAEAKAAEEAAAAEAEAKRLEEEAAAAEVARQAEAKAAEEAAAAEAEAKRLEEEAAAAEVARQAEAKAAEEAAAAEAEAAALEAELKRAEEEVAAQAADQTAAQAEAQPAAEPTEAATEAPAGETPVVEAAPEEPVVEPAQDSAAEGASDSAAEAAPSEPAAEAVVQSEPEVIPLEDLPEETQAAFEEAAAAEAAAVAEPEPVVEATPVDIPEVTAEVVETLSTLLADPSAQTAVVGAAAAALGTLAVGTDGTAPAQTAPESGQATTEPTPPAVAETTPAEVTVTTITEADARSSYEDFADAPKLLEGGRKKSGLSDLEKAGLLALGAIVVGNLLSDGREVVANTGDRVVVRQPDGGYQVYKDDDTLLRRPGSTVRTETFRDGSTRTLVEREDGSQVVTIRDATGRVLRRAVYDRRGNETLLIDDLEPEERIDVSVLPKPRPQRLTISANDEDASLRAELARIEVERIGRTFSLRQIREVPQVRKLAAVIDVDNITFDSGSAVIRTTEARKLAAIGRTMRQLLDANPDEVFLVEGHTDAVGSAASNLTLSDRRAESVALALTEYFGLPPENLVVQGYGEYDLRIDTQANERLNRRAAVRVITPLMRMADLR